MVDLVMPTDPASPTYACDMAKYWAWRYNSLIGFGAEKMTRYKGPNGEQEVQFTNPNTQAVYAEMIKWQGLCAGTGTANTSRRFAIRAGSMRGCGGCGQ
jgi:hypothetical protein